MFTLLAQFKALWGPLRLFDSILFRSAMAWISALGIGITLSPWIFRHLRRLRMAQVFRDAKEVHALADLHAHKKNTPTMGGLAIYASLMASVLFWAKWNIYVWVACGVYTALTLLGFADDFLKLKQKNSRGVPGRQKMLVQGCITFLALGALLMHPDSYALMTQLWVPFYKLPLWETMPLGVAFLLFFCVLSGTSNAINLTDGVDGLAIGCVITVSLGYAVMAYACGNVLVAHYLCIGYVPGAGELTILCSALLGASMAFLWYNAQPAEVFMGDTGSLALGGLIGVIAYMTLQPFTLVIMGGIFVVEALSVILQVGSFKLRRKRIFRMAPIHHHFELKGWPESKVVIRFWILSLMCTIAGLASLKLR